MTIPGFTAGAPTAWRVSSYLGRHGIQYDRPQTDIVVLATNWGSIADNGCQSNGTHKYSAILWNIPWGQSWETACHSTPGPAGTPVAGRLPTDCVTSLNEWGEWYLPDPHCPQPKPPPPRCPAGCYESNVACIAGIVWNACWCYGGNGMCPTGTWWPAGVCIGAWTLGCTP